MQRLSTQFKIKSFYILGLVLGCVWFLLPAHGVSAAQLFLQTAKRTIPTDTTFAINVYVNTENESINAIEAKVSFPASQLELKEVRDGNSIINFWIERPKISQSGTVNFSGIIPGGYQGEGLLFSLVFRAKSPGDATVSLAGGNVLLNDGNGTPASLKLGAVTLTISKEVKKETIRPTVASIIDTDPPEPFTPIVAQSPSLFEGKWFLIFSTQDKGSGIDHYEVCEGNGTSCKVAASPYLLENQKLDQKIFVKAFDKKGNRQLATLPPQKPLPWYKHTAVIATLILIGLIAAAVILYWKRKKILRRKRA